MNIPTANQAREATNMTISKRLAKVKAAKEKKWNIFLKKVDKFFLMEVPKYIALQERYGSYFARMYVNDICIGIDDSEQYLLEKALEILKPLQYKNIKLSFGYLEFNWYDNPLD